MPQTVKKLSYLTSLLTINKNDTTVHKNVYVCSHAAAPYNVTITEMVDNNNVTYVCHADGGPDNNTYEWLRLRDYEVVSLTQELILDNRYPLDGGDYECTVTNTAGNTSAIVTLNGEMRCTRKLYLTYIVYLCCFAGFW